MNLPEEEKILIKDIFNVCVQHQPGDAILLQTFPQEIAQLGPDVSLVAHPTYFDSLLMEILQIPNTDILSYLEQCLVKANYIQQKPWNQSQAAQSFIKYSKQIISNFIYLSQIEYQIFQQQFVIDQQSNNVPDKAIAISQRLMTHFERKGFNQLIIDAIYPKINHDLDTSFEECFLEVIIARARFQTILDSKIYFYLTVLQELLVIPEFKKKFFHLSKCPILPVEASKIQGPMIDTQSPLGILMRDSILGTLPGYFHQEVQALKRFDEKTMVDFGKEKFGKQKIKYYTDLQNQFYSKCTDLFKIFLKKDSQKPFFQWIHASLMSNLGRAKLGHRLMSAKLNQYSHDGLMINIYMSLLNLCKPILSIQNEKYKNINPQYFMYNQRVRKCKYQPLNAKNVFEIKNSNVEFGTITQFFFLAFQFLHVGLIPTYDNFSQYYETKQRLEKMKKKFQQGSPYYAKYSHELEKYRTKNILYYFTLMDDNLINPTIKLFNLFLFLLPKWLNIDYEELNNCRFSQKRQIPSLVYFIPEHMIESIYKFHTSILKFKRNYISMLGEMHIHQLLNLTCFVLSEQTICSNPYVGAKLVQILFYFTLQRKIGVMFDVFKTNRTAHQNLALAMMRFYSDIAVAGAANQFYEKFKYRQFVNKIFTSVWAFEAYRDNMKSYFKTQAFQRFLNMVMSDTTYCFDETNEKYISYKQLERKAEEGELNEEDKKNEEQLSGQMQATLNHSTSNLCLIKQLSKWSPQTFFSEAFLNDIVLLLNNILKTFMDPTTFVSNRQLLVRYRFEKETVLSNLVQIYVNLHINEKFSIQIVKDTRFFKKQYFSKALQKASNQHQTDIETLEKFQELVNALQTSMNEEEDDEIFGEIPDKYLCTLMSTLMKDPVKLPSGYIVDRVYIHKHVLNDERDPFTRAPLKNNEWIQMKELQNEIRVWKKKRLEQLKGGNKQIKYGNIGKNTREQQKNSPFQEKNMNYSGENQIEDREQK